MVIRQEQMETFQADAMGRFENEMVAHSKEFNPRLCAVLGDEQLRMAIREQIEKARSYGFSNQGPIRLFLELMFLFGSHFDTDPQYAPAAGILKEASDQMFRAQDLHEWANDYLDVVHGPDNVNVSRALQELYRLAQGTLDLSGDVETALLKQMVGIFPEKCDYLGEERLKELVRSGIANAQKRGFAAPREQTLITALMFAFGHGCTNDALYPWISRTLQDTRIVDARARAQRLERKAVVWLQHVLSSSEEHPA